MPTKEELLDRIAAAHQRVVAVFDGMEHEEAATQVHMEEGGWSAKQVLQHLTSNDARLDMYLDPNATIESLYGQGYWDWNQKWVDDRDDRDVDSLLAEHATQNASSIEKVRGLSQAELDRMVPASGERPPRPISDWIEVVCINHAVRHSGTVAEVLGIAVEG
jgi:hypothetical protein